MDRRQFLRTSGIALLASAGVGRAAPAGDGRPNILFIMTDQQSSDAMSCRIGHEFLHTPAMDRLAAEGQLFTRAYCANPLCQPSRTSIFTGRYPVQTGVQTNDHATLDPRRFPCMGTVFHQAGYDTGYVGKWHLPFPPKKIESHGFQLATNLAGNGSDAHTPALAAEFLQRKRDRPFLLIASFNNPHNICEWARLAHKGIPEDGGTLPDGPVGVPPVAPQCPPWIPNHEPPAGESESMTLMRRSIQASPMFPVGQFDETVWRQYRWAYYRMIEQVDAQIGQVLDALRDAGLERNTLVVFTSDHGDCQGAHRWNQKTVFYEESARIPLIVRFPGTVAPGLCTHLAQTGIDLLPTFCAFAGVTPPAGLPGRSLRSDVMDPGVGDDPRPFVVVSNHLTQGAPIDGTKPTAAGRMLRSQQYKYCVYDLGERREELFDLENDPGEMVNLAASDEHRAALNRHRRELAAWCREQQDDFPVPAADA